MSALRRCARVLLITVGAPVLSAAGLCGIAALSSLAERLRHGSGPMFADVEFFALAAFALGAAGGLLVRLGLRSRRDTPDPGSGGS